ncbi:MAG: acyltransferase [Verrucomicrobiales bacterium]|nr:acyltransferase [Verrucomicrobiales bacterium]
MRSAIPESNRLDFIQSLRGIAAVLVLLFHVTGNTLYHFKHAPFLGWFEFGEVGVPIFFVISGFIIFHAHRRDLGDPGKLPRYLWRRATRIYPAFWIANAAMCLLYLVRPQFADDPRIMEPAMVAASFALLPTGIDPPLAVAWTLQYEILFYVAFSCGILHRRLGSIAVAVIGVPALATYLLKEFPARYQPPVLDVLFSPLQVLFGLGILAHYLQTRTRDASTPGATRWRNLAAWLALVLALIGAAHVNRYGNLMKAGYVGVSFLFGIATATLIACGPGTAITRVLGKSRLWVFLGNASYSIYLVHSPIISAFMKVGQKLPLDAPWKVEAYGWFTALGALALSTLFSLAVEQPLQNLSRRIWDRFHPESKGSK